MTLAAADLPYTSLQIREMRMAWEELANTHLAFAGYAERIDHRSYAEQGLGLEPRRTVHAGRHHAEIRDGVEGTSRIIPVERLGAEQSARNAELIFREPGQLLGLIARQNSVFTREDVAKALHRYVNDDWLTFNAALERVMADAAVICLDEGGRSDAGRIVPPIYTTVETFRREARMLAAAGRLHADRRRLISDKALAEAFQELPFLVQEQRDAVRHIADGARLSVVRGVAGTGKTTMLAAFRSAADRSGVRVVGAALAGKAAGELRAGSGIESRTLASWERSWASGFNALGRGDVLVIDEAGMVGAGQLGRVLEAVERQGASVVLVGDQRQIGAIESGRAFGNIMDRIGAVELTEVRRQRDEWQREATKTFGAGETGTALDAYHDRGDVRLHEDSATARTALVADYFARIDDARRAGAGQDHLIATYRRADVDLLNEAVRAERHRRGELGEDVGFHTEEGLRTFATGDRVMLRQNDRELGVANGDRARVVEAAEDRLLLQLDHGPIFEIRSDQYAALDYAYAITTHKAQGMTVDRIHVLGTQGMDAALTYVAMSRQRDGATLHAGRDEFRDYAALKAALSRESRARGIGDYVWDAPAFERIHAAIETRERGTAEAFLTKKESIQQKLHHGIFAGLKLALNARIVGEHEKTVGQFGHNNEKNPVAMLAQDHFFTAATRYAWAWVDAFKMRTQNLPVLPHQREALRGAAAALDTLQPQAARDLASALMNDLDLRRAFVQTGQECGVQLAAGIVQEREVRLGRDPELRAVRIVAQWRRLEQAYRLLQKDDAAKRDQIEAQLGGLIQEIQENPQLASVIRSRAVELELTPGSTLSQALRDDHTPASRKGSHRTRTLGPGWGL